MALHTDEKLRRTKIIEEKGVFFYSAPLSPGQAPLSKESADALMRANMDALIDNDGLLNGDETEKYFRELLA